MAGRFVCHQSTGGSSLKTRVQISIAIRFATIEVSAPTPGEQAAPHQALCQVVLHGRLIQADGPEPPFCADSRPPQIASTTRPLARSYSSSVRGSTSKIQPVSSCSIAP